MRSLLKTWLDQPIMPRTGRAERREVPGLVAYHTEGADAQPDPVWNISATGMYLLTPTRWVLGSPVDLTLQRQGMPEEFAENRIALKAIPVRWGADGVGLSFQLAKGTAVKLWEGKSHDVADSIEPVDVVREFRVARAESFLKRICPSLGERVSRALRNDVGSIRTESVIEIALRADDAMTANGETGRKLIHPEVLRHILDHGSWAETDWMRALWTNLLVTSCTPAGTDAESLSFAELLSQMNPNQTRLLNWVCEMVAGQMSESGSAEPESIRCTVDQLKRVVGVGDLVRVERELEHLTELDLLKKRARRVYLDELDDLALCPTALAMEYYARSRGQREFAPVMFKVSPVVAQASLNSGD